jgi:hypothetical protein
MKTKGKLENLAPNLFLAGNEPEEHVLSVEKRIFYRYLTAKPKFGATFLEFFVAVDHNSVKEIEKLGKILVRSCFLSSITAKTRQKFQTLKNANKYKFGSFN